MNFKMLVVSKSNKCYQNFKAFEILIKKIFIVYYICFKKASFSILTL